MWLGTYNIPEVRLYPDILNDVKKFSLIKPRIPDVDQIYTSSNSFGRVTVFDLGGIDIVDEKTLAIAESFFDIIKSRVTSSSSDIKSIPTKSIK